MNEGLVSYSEEDATAVLCVTLLIINEDREEQQVKTQTKWEVNVEWTTDWYELKLKAAFTVLNITSVLGESRLLVNK